MSSLGRLETSLGVELPFTSEHEYQSLRLYLESSKLAGPFETSFWVHYIPQRSFQVPAIRYALVALSTFHHPAASKDPHLGPSLSGKLRNTAIEFYNKSIVALKSHLGCSDENSMQIVLVSCLLYTLLECAFGNYERGAAIHLQSGLNLLGKLRSDSPNEAAHKTSKREATAFECQLSHLFAELELQAAFLFDIRDKSKLEELRNSRLFLVRVVQTDFGSLSEARHVLENILSDTFDYYRSEKTVGSPHEPRMGRKLQDQYQLLAYRYEQWSVKFSTYIIQRQGKISHADLQGAVHLKIKQKFTQILLKMSSLMSSEIWQLNKEHESLVSMIQAFVETRTASGRNDIREEGESRRAGCSIGASTVLPLYFTAMYCADMRLRRRAVDIMRSFPRREGFWNGALMAEKVARKIDSAGLDETMMDR
jgi:hypothetical protein